MGMSSLSGKARTDVNNPVAFKVCDRCGAWRNGNELTWQHQWAGNALQNLRILVCRDICLDEPQEQIRSIVLPPDPVPTRDPRLEPFAQDANGGNLAGSSPLVYNGVPGSNPVTNWDQPGITWDTPGEMWDLTVPS